MQQLLFTPVALRFSPALFRTLYYHVLQPVLGAGGSPDALVGRLYAGHGRNSRLAENSPPRNTSFGTSSRSDLNGSDSVASPIGGVSGLIRSRAKSVRDLPTEQQDLLVPRLLHSSVSQASSLQQGDGINSPPRIGLRRRSSGNKRSGPLLAPSGDSSVTAGLARSRHATTDQSGIGGGMTLSRSLGALGQAGAGRSTLAIVNTRDDGAPYLRSERMSPKSSLRAASKRPAPGGEPLRCVLALFR